jgi:hypothetical protein
MNSSGVSGASIASVVLPSAIRQRNVEPPFLQASRAPIVPELHELSGAAFANLNRSMLKRRSVELPERDCPFRRYASRVLGRAESGYLPGRSRE